MRLAYLCLQATREGQGSHAHVHEIVNGLENRGVRVSLFEPSHSNKRETLGAIPRLMGAVCAQVRLIIRIEAYDVLYIRAHYLSVITAMVAAVLGIPYILELNGPVDDGKDLWRIIRLATPLLKITRELEVRYASGVVAVTPRMAEQVRVRYQDKPVSVIPNGANVRLFSPLRRSEAVPVQQPYVVFVGAMAEWQGLAAIVDSVLSSEWPAGVSMVFVGNGVDRPVIEDAARICEHIFYMGVQPYDGIGAIVANSVASLALVRSEGSRGSIGASPLKLFEGMACGVPMIVTDIDFMAQVVTTHNCGIVLPRRYAPKQLCDAIRHLMAHEDVARRMGENGRRAVESFHSWECRAKQTFDFIERIVYGTGE